MAGEGHAGPVTVAGSQGMKRGLDDMGPMLDQHRSGGAGAGEECTQTEADCRITPSR